MTKCCLSRAIGFIESRITRLLVESGRDVVVLGRSDTPTNHHDAPQRTFVAITKIFFAKILGGFDEVNGPRLFDGRPEQFRPSSRQAVLTS